MASAAALRVRAAHGLAARRPGLARIKPAAAAPATAMTTRSQGIQSGLRPSSTQAQLTVTSSVPASTARAAGRSRIRHSATAPMPTSAPIAGASATV